MKQSLSEILAKLHESKETGIFSIIFASEKNLLKFYLRDGEIYHISFGLKKGLQCLNELHNREPISYNFVPNIEIDMKSEDILSTAKLLDSLKQIDKPISSQEISSIKSAEFQKIKEQIKISLIKQIGPIGGKIIEKYIDEKWFPSNPLTKNDILKLVDMLKDEIEDLQSKKEFLSEVNKLLEVYK